MTPLKKGWIGFPFRGKIFNGQQQYCHKQDRRPTGKKKQQLPRVVPQKMGIVAEGECNNGMARWAEWKLVGIAG